MPHPFAPKNPGSSVAALEWAIQDANFSFTDFPVWAVNIRNGRMGHHAETTTLSMLPWQVNSQREAC
jgi:hypothetical protein